VPLAKGKAPLSLAQQLKNAVANGAQLVGQAFAAGANKVRGGTHKPHL